MTSDQFLPFALPDIGEEEIQAVVSTLRSGWITTGPQTFRFEREFQNYVGAKTALAVNSCTAGLHLALSALGVGPGDEVITTPLTFCATVNAILETGATPVLADIGPDLNVTPAAIRSVITERTRAILPVHMAGLPCDLDEIWRIAAEHRLVVIEDAAHAAGARYHNVPIGCGKSDAVVFSFYATKNLTTGEGGMVTALDEAVHQRMRILSLHGISRDAWRRYSQEGNWFYEIVERGYKYNLSDIMSSIGIEQLHKLDGMTTRRSEIAQAYNHAFREMPELEPPRDHTDCLHCWHLYVLRLNLDALAIDRGHFFSEMHTLGVGCSVHFIPIPLHPYYKKLELAGDCPRALWEYPRLLSLPLYSKMTDEEVQRAIDAVKTVVAKFRRAKKHSVASFAEETALR